MYAQPERKEGGKRKRKGKGERVGIVIGIGIGKKEDIDDIGEHGQVGNGRGCACKEEGMIDRRPECQDFSVPSHKLSLSPPRKAHPALEP